MSTREWDAQSRSKSRKEVAQLLSAWNSLSSLTGRTRSIRTVSTGAGDLIGPRTEALRRGVLGVDLLLSFGTP